MKIRGLTHSICDCFVVGTVAFLAVELKSGRIRGHDPVRQLQGGAQEADWLLQQAGDDRTTFHAILLAGVSGQVKT
jgi:hypothetical protein